MSYGYMWKVGDKAVALCGRGGGRPKKGEIYTVSGVTMGKNEPGLNLREVPNPIMGDGKPNPLGYLAKEFRPVVPDKAERADNAFITLLKTMESKNKKKLLKTI